MFTLISLPFWVRHLPALHAGGCDVLVSAVALQDLLQLGLAHVDGLAGAVCGDDVGVAEDFLTIGVVRLHPDFVRGHIPS